MRNRSRTEIINAYPELPLLPTHLKKWLVENMAREMTGSWRETSNIPAEPIMPWSYSRKRSLTALIMADLHSGSSFAPWDPTYELQSPGENKGRTLGLTDIQRELMVSVKHFCGFVRSLRPNVFLTVGDLTDGINRRGHGYETMTPNLDDQSNVSTIFLKALDLPDDCAKYGVRGSDYHNAQYNDCEMKPIKEIGGQYCGVMKRLNIAGHSILITHKVSGAQFYLE